MTSADDLRDTRERLVLRHVQAENDRDIAAVMATFAHPRYEIVPTGKVFDGEAAVRAMILAQWETLPPVQYSAAAIYHGDDGVVVETRTTAPDTSIDMLSVNVFGFEGAGLILERCYFDRMQVGAQLGYQTE
ncbi:hypothetical protein A5658_07770 [Mycobacterium sp. 1245111.1]|uniref:nuclear transport factor 2 family protein n=1 Tax=Mycobacterium sp. 1245111.1 TaxID=1834073 RepID=UPI0008008019|nr:nuclear transport factor 2 family protein [Mycobacterium sp. 1245111.1]OBK35318.1 hypothetical protein A5658_07770 [Mycobacterium sp. 1245111.1]